MYRKRSSIPASIQNAVLERDTLWCTVCGSDMLLHRSMWEFGHHVDYMYCHEHTVENISIMCYSCNRIKPPHKTEEEYQEWRKNFWRELVIIARGKYSSIKNLQELPWSDEELVVRLKFWWVMENPVLDGYLISSGGYFDPSWEVTPEMLAKHGNFNHTYSLEGVA